MGLLNSVGTVGNIASGNVVNMISNAITNTGQYLGLLDGISLTDTFLDQNAESSPSTNSLEVPELGQILNGAKTESRKFLLEANGPLQIGPNNKTEGKNENSILNTPTSKGDENIGLESLVKFPFWGYNDFINERSVWQKGLSSPYGEPGYFYFKIFFDFDTDFGLLGGILNRTDPIQSTSSAAKYLTLCQSSYFNYKIPERLEALKKFVRTLSYININAPWFFKSIKGLDKADVPLVDELSKERTIEIEFNPDAIDMRLTSLMSLYKFACYDDINHLVILPDNLRKFDMSVLIFETPIKYLHTAFKNGGLIDAGKSMLRGLISKNNSNEQKDYFRYKTAYFDSSAALSPTVTRYKNGFAGDGWQNTMSFKMFTFLNCEIKLDSIGNMNPSSVNNDIPFQMGNSSISISYDKVLTTTSNEFMRMIWGSSGIYFNQYSSIQLNKKQKNTKPRNMVDIARDAYNYVMSGGQKDEEDEQMPNNDLQQERYKAIKKIHEFTPFLPPQTQKEVIDAAEKVMHNNLTMLSGMGFGNLYGQDAGVSIKDLLGSDRHTTDYWDQKMNWLKNRHKSNETGRNILKALSNIAGVSSGKSYRPADVIGMSDSGISKYTDKSLSYWKEKIKALKGDDVISNPTTGEGTYSARISNVILQRNISTSEQLQKPIREKATKMKQGTKELQPNDWSMNGTNKAKEHLNEYIDQERSNNFINKFGEGVAKYGVGTEYWFEKIRSLQEANLTTEQKHYIQEEIENMAVKLSSSKDGKSTIPEYQSKIKDMANEMKDGTLEPGRSYIDLINEMAQKIKDGTLEPGRSYTELILAMATKMKSGTLEPGRSYTELIAAMAQKIKDGTLEPGRSYTELIAAMAQMMKDGTLEPGRSYTELIAAMAQMMKDGTLEPGRSYTELIAAMAKQMKDGTLEPGRSYVELIQAMAEMMKHGTLEPGRSYTELIQAMAEMMKHGTLEPGRSYTELILAMAKKMKDGTLEPGRSYTDLISAMAKMMKDGTLDPGRSYTELIQSMASMIKDGTLEPGRSYVDLIQSMAEAMKHGTLEPGRSYTELIQVMAQMIKNGTLEPGRSYTELIEAMAIEMKKGTLEPGTNYVELIQFMAEEIKKGTLEPGKSYSELIQAMATLIKKGKLEQGRDHVEEIQAMASNMKKGTQK